ncbi:uncharacterized protein LOC119947641 [Tachyglossus aculeatus]|uniref:uncharacterized protein LOC119947641 n=1 Tax=Tachyglossus aculeatus TaxID=9261 RepID=UPI0018F6AF64|nr:uncharacterized protein LOC119947641 [Tachyglossus aculeatus]
MVRSCGPKAAGRFWIPVFSDTDSPAAASLGLQLDMGSRTGEKTRSRPWRIHNVTPVLSDRAFTPENVCFKSPVSSDDTLPGFRYVWHKQGMEGEVTYIKTRVVNMISRFQEETGFDLSIPETPQGKSKRKLCKAHFLEKLNLVTSSAQKQERLLEDIFTWINNWGFIFSEELPSKNRHVAKDEWANIIAQMLPLVLITKDRGVSSLVTLCSHLIGEKKRSQKRARTKGMLWKRWRERGLQSPAVKPPTTKEMLHDPAVVATCVQEIRAMLTELLGSSFFNKSEMDIIRHMNETVENLGEALAIQKQEKEALKCQCDYLHAQLEGLSQRAAPKVPRGSKLIPHLPRRAFPVTLTRQASGESRLLNTGVVNIELAADAVGAWRKPRSSACCKSKMSLSGLGSADPALGSKGQPGKPEKPGAGFRLLGQHSGQVEEGEMPEAQLQEPSLPEYKEGLARRQLEALEESNLCQIEVLASTSLVTSGSRGRRRGGYYPPSITTWNNSFIPSMIKESISEDDPPNSPESPPTPEQSDTG